MSHASAVDVAILALEAAIAGARLRVDARAIVVALTCAVEQLTPVAVVARIAVTRVYGVNALLDMIEGTGALAAALIRALAAHDQVVVLAAGAVRAERAVAGVLGWRERTRRRTHAHRAAVVRTRGRLLAPIAHPLGVYDVLIGLVLGRCGHVLHGPLEQAPAAVLGVRAGG